MTAVEAETEFFKSDSGTIILKCIKCESGTFSSVTEWADHQFNVHQNNVGWGHGPIRKPGTKKPMYRKLLPCPECWKIIPTLQLTGHIDAVHKNNPQFVCSVCGKGFGRKLTLKQHELIHQETNRNTHLCLLCGSTFRNKGENLEHKVCGNYN